MPVEELEARDRAADVAEEPVQDPPVLGAAGVQRGANFVELEPATGASLGREPVNAGLAVRQGLLLGAHENPMLVSAATDVGLRHCHIIQYNCIFA